MIWLDPYKREHPALLTAVFDAGDEATYPNPAVNLVWVSGDESKEDSYGRQIERMSSCAHVSSNSAGANCWKRVGE